MDIGTAKEIIGPDRVLIISIIEFLIRKGMINDRKELNILKEICKENLSEFKKHSRDEIIKIQIEQSKLIIEHIFNSFMLK